MSQANIVPANIDASAPSILYTGRIIGDSIMDKIGVAAMTPAIANANVPIDRIPSSNCSPYPSLFPRSRSIAPRIIKHIMIRIITELTEILCIHSSTLLMKISTSIIPPDNLKSPFTYMIFQEYPEHRQQSATLDICPYHQYLYYLQSYLQS